MFADNYIQRNQVQVEIPVPPHPGLGMVVVIPCYHEPDILLTLQSVADCQHPACHVEVIVLINHSESESEAVKAENFHTRQIINDWIEKQKHEQIKFYAIGPVNLKKKWAGAGLARKKGMDEAVVRFNHIDNPDGIIISLDADTLVERNYLKEIENYYRLNTSHAGATISFNHQVDGLSNRHLQGIRLYEKYMDYYKSALGYTGYPYAMFTVGSAFTVRAWGYVKRGGMNRRKAGEDFYFLQNLVQVGTVGEISSTVVHPSARLSDRVPFGTGPLLQKWLEGKEDMTITYNFDAFIDLKVFFDVVESLYGISLNQYNKLLDEMPLPVHSFLKDTGFWHDLETLNRNCASLSSFVPRFYHTFNAFRILKFLNYTHELYYKKTDLVTQLSRLNKVSI